MHRCLLLGFIAALIAPAATAQTADEANDLPGFVIGGSRYLAAGANAIRDGRYDEGIRLTLRGLEQDSPSVRDRAAGLANLCAAYVAKEEPDPAIDYCSESLELNDRNWRPYSNRSHAYLLKGMYAEASRDHQAAAAIAPRAAHVRMIGEALNEQGLRPSITMREHR